MTFIQRIARTLLCLAFILGVAHADEPHAARIVANIAAAKQAVLDHGGEDGGKLDPERCVFVSFWDFDGTILAGDCSEGYVVDGKVAYTGLYEECILAGLSKIYPANAGGVEKAMLDYRSMEHKIGAWLAYPFMPQTFRGAYEKQITTLAAQHFATKQKPYVFASSLAMMRELDRMGVRVCVISASADVFIKSVTPELGVPVAHARGIRTKVVDGVLTERLEYPVTYAEGKTEALREDVREIQEQNPGKKVFVLAGFGNSYSTDGAFLKHIAHQALPAAKPVVVMINGGTPKPGFENEFTCVEQKEVIGR